MLRGEREAQEMRERERGNAARETRDGGKIQNEAVEWRRAMGRKGGFQQISWGKMIQICVLGIE